MPLISLPQTAGSLFPDLLRPSPQSTYAAWPVWADSTRQEVRFFSQPKKQVLRWWHQVKEWNAQTREPGRHGGGIGLPAMAVLECLIFKFHNWASGRLDPSYDSLQKATGLCRQAVADALAKLKALGIINWLRRCTEDKDDTGAFRLRQLTNAYAVLPPSQWRGYVEPPSVPPPDPTAWGACPPLPSPLEQYSVDVKSGASRVEALAALAADADSDLARALASLGRAMHAVQA